MLDELHVAGLGVIEEATLELAPGLNVLTGETGAGKTMVTVALALALGARASVEIVREGEPAASVEARFSVRPREVADEPDEAESRSKGEPDDVGEPGSWAEDGELVLARIVRADGRSSARAGGRLAPVSVLAALGRGLVEVHGQHQAERLLEAGAQRAFLDRFAGPEHGSAVEALREAHAAVRAAVGRLRAVDLEAREREREKDLLAYQVREIEAVDPRPGEDADLEGEESRLAHAERILDLVGGAGSALGRDGGAADLLREAAAALGAVRGMDPEAGPLAGRVAALAAEADDAVSELRAYGDSVEANPARLEEVRARRRALADLERKYGEGVDGVLSYLGEARERLARLDGVEAERAGLEEEALRFERRAARLAETVSRGRSEAAPRLAASVTAELRELGMPGAQVEVRLEATPERSADGAERVSFAFSGGPGQPMRPLAKAASGGELSRTMLACRSVLADLDSVPTLVFDEVDAGIGGRTAAAVGERLAKLAAGRQVLVVTHLAQIASHADRHFRVTKDGGAAEVRPLEDAERAAELARMLSGEVTDVSLAHARDLMGAR